MDRVYYYPLQFAWELTSYKEAGVILQGMVCMIWEELMGIEQGPSAGFVSTSFVANIIFSGIDAINCYCLLFHICGVNKFKWFADLRVP